MDALIVPPGAALCRSANGSPGSRAATYAAARVGYTMPAMGYQLLGKAVWWGAKRYLGRRARQVSPKQKAAALGLTGLVAALAVGGAVLAGRRGALS